MKLRAVQWNIGGSLVRADSDDATERSSYGTESVDYIVDQLGRYDASVVTLQETHADDQRVQAEEIAGQLGYQTWANHEYAPSHLVVGQQLGQAVLSRFPLAAGGPEDDVKSTPAPESFTALSPRSWQAYQDNGELWHWMNKGISVVRLALADDTDLSVATLHLPVFKRLGVEPASPEAHSVLREAQGIILSRVGSTALLQGDFNIDDPTMRGYMHDLFVCGFGQYIQRDPTTPTGRHYDHVLSRGANIVSSETDPTVLTDHYPLITDIEV